MGYVGVDGANAVFLCTKIYILISEMSRNSSDLNIKVFEFLTCTKDFEMGIERKTSSGSSPWMVSDVLSSITEEVKIR